METRSHGPRPIAMRAFGRAEDLDIEFGSNDRPALVTVLLDRCAHVGDPTFWWAQPVGARTEAILRLVELTEGMGSVTVSLPCIREECGEPFSVELPMDALRDADPGTMRIELPGGRVAHMRRPTGNDLRQWHAARSAARDDAVAQMIDALCLDGNVAPEHRQTLADALAALDPLVAFSVSCTCPTCGAECNVPVDLESLALQRLAARQRQVLREVHLLASRYGWTEEEVLAVPPQRRARYLALIEDEA